VRPLGCAACLPSCSLVLSFFLFFYAPPCVRPAIHPHAAHRCGYTCVGRSLCVCVYVGLMRGVRLGEGVCMDRCCPGSRQGRGTCALHSPPPANHLVIVFVVLVPMNVVVVRTTPCHSHRPCRHSCRCRCCLLLLLLLWVTFVGRDRTGQRGGDRQGAAGCTCCTCCCCCCWCLRGTGGRGLGGGGGPLREGDLSVQQLLHPCRDVIVLKAGERAQ
jgi:hypothetical protein